MQDQPNNNDNLTKEDLEIVKQWLFNKGNSIDKELFNIIHSMVGLCINAHDVLKSNKKLLELLRQHMGYIPTKERSNKNDVSGTTADNPVAEPWNKTTENKLHEKSKQALKCWQEYKKQRPEKPKKRQTKKANETQSTNTEEQVTKDESPESVFQVAAVQLQNKNKDINVDSKYIPNNLISPSSSYQIRKRFDLSFCLTEITYKVETIQDPIAGFSKTAKVDEGPARFKITWETMAQIVLLVTGMCIPMVRLASCLKSATSYFSPTRIYRICLYVSHAIFAIYLQIFRELATCDRLSGDDTNNKVLNMMGNNQPITDEEKAIQKQNLDLSKKEPDPQKAKILLEAEELLGGQQYTKDGEKLKKQILTSVVIGERSKLGTKGTLIFYYTERKSFGDLLGSILLLNSKNNIDVKDKIPIIIQTDLSTQNIPSPYPNNMQLTFIGCAAHARRPFWRYRSDSDHNISYYCYTLLLLFDKIFDSDREARSTGDPKKIIEIRTTIQKPLWDEIKQYCLEINEQYAPSSDFGSAATYVIKHFAKLTYYLVDAGAKPDNNLAERLLRYEKIMLDNSKFRVSKLGRLSYDILRTILSNCSIVGIKPLPYLVYVMRNQLEARQNPEKFTPYAYYLNKT